MRDSYAPIARGYADALADELAGKPLDRAFLDAFAERCRGPILEVGCGPGQIAAYLASRGAEVAGLDLSPAMIAEARRLYPAIAFEVGDMFALPHRGLAGIAAFYAIVHTRDFKFASFAAALAPGGLVAIAFHAGDETIHVDELFGAKTSLDFYYHRPETVIAALERDGLHVEARLERRPYPGEHQSQRCYLLAARV